jgi:hypothetical protein
LYKNRQLLIYINKVSACFSIWKKANFREDKSNIGIKVYKIIKHFTMKKLLFLVIIVLCECTDSPSKQQGNKIHNSITPLFSFHCSDYGDLKFDTKIYINDSLLIIKHYGVAHSEKIIVDSTTTIALKGKVVPTEKHYLYLQEMAKMTQVPINNFVKTDCNYKNIPHHIKDTERTKIWGCNAIDITGDGGRRNFCNRKHS